MEKTAEKALAILRDIKSVVISSVTEGKPHSRIIDIMVHDDEGLLFTTCTTKPFYRQIMETPCISITAMTKDYVQVRLDAEIKVVDHSAMDAIYEQNPEFGKLFPDKSNMDHYKVFRVFKGKGELFDLSGRKVKMERERFSFGGEPVNDAGCIVNDDCISCGACEESCPFGAISMNDELGRYEIDSRYCDECGCCVAVCPVSAIHMPVGM